ncbi:hypothetical protein OO013_17095 [Mangrovivirga sp. M17]|uniref:Disease resistance R13L4/SHOC-2-like LRR domain-containing protein n=1 Tax=Mangrovivirga halotolerans TaxID=2993936 RepID=A0ABT3RUZ3_9BACT|nr:hypothetical protein [Mangrovivirga halotolerans]MCX2745601.1 hypothetical protein [Mangrovivirga halotolerans]
MPLTNKIFPLVIVLIGSILFTGCSDDDPTLNREKEILSFQFLMSQNSISTNVIGEIDHETNTIFAVLPGNSLKTALVPAVISSTGATVTPIGVQDFSVPVTYTITAEDGTSEEYEVRVVNERDALVAIYEANSSNDLGWNLYEPDLSQWDGVFLFDGVIVELRIHNSLLEVIPPEIGYLKNLKVLMTHMNNNASLPPEIGKLTNLERLSVGINNYLSSVPPEIGQLRSLKNLWIDNNPSLTSIPREIGQLSNLQNLFINGNGFSIIPGEICAMSTEYGTTIYTGVGMTCE